MKLAAALKDARERLLDAEVPDAEFDARAMAAHVLKVKPSKLAMQRDRLLTGKEMAALEVLVNSRARREPLQYLLGATEFYGRDFVCDPRALVPRPDTEVVIDVALELTDELDITTVADIGTGSGVIAITLALESPEIDVIATDNSADALELASENVAMHDLQQRITLACGEWLDPLHQQGRVDEIEMIVSNPPYICENSFDALMPEIVEHEPREALVDAAEDGLGSYRAIVGEARRLPALKAMVFEVGDGRATQVAELMREALKAREIIIRKDLGRLDRVVAAVMGVGGR